MAEIAPDFRDPVSGQTLAELWSKHAEFASPAAKVILRNG
jgi:hypothetical protein